MQCSSACSDSITTDRIANSIPWNLATADVSCKLLSSSSGLYCVSILIGLAVEAYGILLIAIKQ